ncbi:SAM-dependent methyltransferase [Desulfosarcina ovata subsp. sediminis]|uniref:SAM-dependent methyltransferase n=1 Tax=Desulfosarcina ovata subsp. sediminis TaxID=885957 RepID=A0A5K7ZP01_9BACT|nr:class I SAM-dependent methyltransferase [Desulfosarcina ovata]BBO82405.1 SAM-dependent methyltransferase [Desulfosarcina ovata subsp. sediminis]
MIYETDLKGVIATRWSIRARTYDLSPGHGIHSEREKQAWVNILSDALDQKTNLTVLDVGTGTGALALLLAEMNHNVVGIDLSEKMLARARDKARTASLKADFKIGDAESPPFEKESFDAIVCRHLLWTLPNPERAVDEWRNVLKPGGRVVIIDGNFGKSKRTALQEVWRYMAMPLILLTEFRDPRWLRDLDTHLPMRQRERPAADIEILEKAGFTADVNPVKLPRKYSLLKYMKYGYSRHSQYQFVVNGVKTA